MWKLKYGELVLPEGPFSHLIKKPRKDPPLKQLTLFETFEDQVRTDIIKLKNKFIRKDTVIKHIAKNHELPISKAKTLYEKIVEEIRHELEYEYYIKNKDYFDWYKSEEGQKEIREYINTLEKRKQKRDQIFELKLQKGKEHVVEVVIPEELKPELQKILDNPRIANLVNYHGPFSHFIKHPGLTEYDAKILHKNGCIKVIMGDEGMLFNHKFIKKERLNSAKHEAEKIERFYCDNCQKELDYNTIGLNKKLGYRTKYFCLECLGLSEAEANSIMEFYKSLGCTMFI